MTNTQIADHWALNHQIVLLLGWHELRVAPVIFEGDDPTVGHYRIVNEWVIADKDDVPLMRPWASSELAWEHAPTPDYMGDLNLAWRLFADLPDEWTPRLVRMLVARGELVSMTKAVIMHNVSGEEYSSICDDAAAAICHTWLGYQEAQK